MFVGYKVYYDVIFIFVYFLKFSEVRMSGDNIYLLVLKYKCRIKGLFLYMDFVNGVNKRCDCMSFVVFRR